MSVSEAVLLVLQAGAVGEGGEVFVLDMGEPVHILDLARDMIRLAGLEPDTDVPIVLTDPEPGEKEHEDLLAAEEGTTATRHERIFVAPGTVLQPLDALSARISAMEALLEARDVAGIIEMLCGVVPTYRPSDLVFGRTESPPVTRAEAVLR
jgi:FlaA1/EpsC-like NDP-sugar epimerase